MIDLNRRDRILPLTGGHNFRDLGGYETTDGQMVAWGRVFRSGTLFYLTDADQAVIHALGIRVVCDFRSSRERRNRPSRFAPHQSFEVWFREHETSAGDLAATMEAPGANAQIARQMLIDLYRGLVYEQVPSYRELFTRIAAGELPIMFHCSAGKDRTGIGAALLLDLLGVPRETIIEDYVLTDHCFERGCDLLRREPNYEAVAARDQEVWAPMIRADRAYIETMFQTIAAHHGSTEGFIRAEMQLDSATIAAIRHNLLVSPPG